MNLPSTFYISSRYSRKVQRSNYRRTIIVIRHDHLTIRSQGKRSEYRGDEKQKAIYL